MIVLAISQIVFGCTVGKIQTKTSPSFHFLHFGSLDLANIAEQESAIITTRSIGFTSTTDGSTLGYKAVRTITIDKDCQVVVVVENKNHLQSARNIAEEIAGTCTLQ